MEEWKEYKYTDLCSLIGGGTPKTSEPTYWGGNIPWLSVKDFGNDEKYVHTTEKTITEAGLDNSPTKLLHKDDIIISARGTIGAIAMLASDMAFNQSCFGIRSNDLVDQQYLYYLTKTKITELQKNSHGSVFDTITRDTFAKIRCYIPPKDEQMRIATILSSLDNKIELNRQINDNLEQQAQALFNYYFVDNINELEEYSEGALTDVASYLNGLAMQKFRPGGTDCGLPVLKIKELGQGFCDSNSDRCSSYIKNDYLIDNGEIIFSWSGTLMVDFWCSGKCGLNQHLFKVTSDEYPKWFIYFWTKHHLDQFIRIANDKAVTMGHIKRTELDNANVLIPSAEKIGQIGATIAPMIDQLINNRVEMMELSSLRDSLLPKLMSGELKINNLDC